MPTRSQIRSRSCSGSKDGVALLAVLAFVLLLTILVVGFLAFMKLNKLSTVEYGNAVQAQEIAQGGMQDILSDFHQEIVAGSVSSSTYTQNGVVAYIPSTNVTVVPARLGYAATTWGTGPTTAPTAAPATLMPTLVRVSRADSGGGTALNPPLSTTSYTNLYSASNPKGGLILNRASLASTGSASVDGRYISPTRWNKPYLLASSTTLLPTPFYGGEALPLASYPGTPDLPDWVYVTRTGSRVCSTAEAKAGTLGVSSDPTVNYGPTATGSNPPASPVIGRYAYAVYDEGALLDANVAGYTAASNGVSITARTNVVSNPADPVTGMTMTVNGKSYLTGADLTQLPGATSYGKLTQATVDAFVQWRNASAAAGGNNYLTSIINGATAYAKMGFMVFQPNDSPLLGRQDLINYIAQKDTSLNTTSPSSAGFSQALPYLGTFSRAVSAPSYIPPTDSSIDPNYVASLGTAVTYHARAENSGVINRDLANVRFASAGTITHYNDDATVTAGTYTVNAGDPLLQNRFSLAKINWLSQTWAGQSDPGSTASGYAGSVYPAAIQACFGLKWGVVGTLANGGNACWSYVGSPAGTGGTLAAFNGTIETLDQVAKEAREPNFFELLKASIFSGSVGLSPGPAGFSNGTGASSGNFRAGGGTYTGGIESLDGYSYDRAGTIPAPAGISDMQIMKIGANIIDQYDTDSYPTAIYFHYAYTGTQLLPSPYDVASWSAWTSTGTGTGELFGPGDMVYGEENLPELQGVYEFAGTDTATTTNDIEAWWQPELWNPHLEPSTTTLTTAQSNSIPNHFKIRGYGSAYIQWLQENSAALGAPSGHTLPTQLDNDAITFTDSAPTTSAFYANPSALTTTLSNVSVTPTGTDAGNMTAPNMTNYSQNSFVGFWIGNDGTFTYNADSGGNIYEVYTYAQYSTGLTFSLGWTDSNGGFHPYSYIPYFFGYSDAIIGHEKGDDEHGSANPIGGKGDAEWHDFLEPRSLRFATLCGWQGQIFNSTFFPNGYSGATPNYPNADNYGQGKPSASNFQWVGGGPSYLEIAWQANSTNAITQTGLYAVPPGGGTTPPPSYYGDPDGVVRPGDGLYANAASNDGFMSFITAGRPSGASGLGDNTIPQQARRPVILNRPFRSVGELGYVSRDLPFKTLDFFSPSSADAALLDVFSLTDESKVSSGQINSVVAGQVNLSNAPNFVLLALLSGTCKKDMDPAYAMSTAAGQDAGYMGPIITGLLQSTGTPGPLINRAALVTQVQAALQSISGGILVDTSRHFSNKIDQFNKSYLEAPVRALANVTSTRTWNLLIDIIAQSGQMSPAATTLDNFVVHGERRYWLHVSIDRYTGKVVAQQLEPVYE